MTSADGNSPQKTSGQQYKSGQLRFFLDEDWLTPKNTFVLLLHKQNHLVSKSGHRRQIPEDFWHILKTADNEILYVSESWLDRYTHDLTEIPKTSESHDQHADGNKINP